METDLEQVLPIPDYGSFQPQKFRICIYKNVLIVNLRMFLAVKFVYWNEKENESSGTGPQIPLF
jgi:hypothetical protein